MTSSERLFLVLAEELNFGRAARKSFISQQSLSDHIKRLEEHYGVSLFTRRPAVELTEAGRAVQRSLLAIRNLEHGLDAELAEIQRGASGKLRVGLNYTRAKLIVPELFEWCRMEYPRVKIELTLEETLKMQDLLKKGELDCFLGVNATAMSEVSSRSLSVEGIYLLASRSYLERYAGIDTSELVNVKSSADLHDFDGLPFVMNYPISTTYKLIAQYMAVEGIVVETVLSVSDYEISEKICRSGDAALCCPQIFVPRILERNIGCDDNEYVYALPVRGLENSLRFELIYNAMIHQPRFVSDSFDKIADIVRRCEVIS